MRAHLVSMPEQMLASEALIGGRIHRGQVGFQRYLGIHHNVATIGSSRSSRGRNRHLWSPTFPVARIAMLDHARQLDHALELDFPPAATYRRSTQRAHQIFVSCASCPAKSLARDQRIQPA